MDCYRTNESEIVVRMFADQIDAAGSAVKTVRTAAPKRFLKCLAYDTRFDSQSIDPPKIAITRPAYRFTFTDVNGAELFVRTPMPMRISPRTKKKNPVGMRRSIEALRFLPEQQI